MNIRMRMEGCWNWRSLTRSGSSASLLRRNGTYIEDQCFKGARKSGENREGSRKEGHGEEGCEACNEGTAGGLTSAAFRREADGLDQQAAFLGQQIHDGEEELLRLKEKCEIPEADRERALRHAQMERLTRELVDTFMKEIYVYKNKRPEITWNFRQS